ncbi:concanavalin A-like lectin/glucanase domain-containing protein [Gilbertella persicaria]|uniref:GH16 domain-containing protein n=1 Tax=Rhizopus stolonifer TaxID=4846 RepID=A0A367KIM6_RHIST|nr:concanavalin A-like lectin/glucanase domain-containing protein [Gilbertella persicaria]KAI8091030.1 concanavalin A-like lectin/glucanase domain-containing protein [Gilbertella persicaria]RCI02018.1 hypothetical protein CU098_010909 [Rhizopus stolonifer]
MVRLLKLLSLATCLCVVKSQDVTEKQVVSSVMYAPVPTNRMALAHPLPAAEFIASNGEQKTVCHNFRTEFNKNSRGWIVENTMQDTYDVNQDGIQLNLLPPKQYVRLLDTRNLPYNQIGGRGPTLNATTYIRYGRISATMKTASGGGSVTAFILIADDGDEIDFEIVGGDFRSVQTNYFWGRDIEYTVNGAVHQIKGADLDKAFHRYTIDWSPEKIDWIIDDQIVRTKTRAETCDASGVCKFPSRPARVQVGLWDGSIESGTAAWSRGPIDWSLPHSISAYIKDIHVDCNPEYNQIVN